MLYLESKKNISNHLNCCKFTNVDLNSSNVYIRIYGTIQNNLKHLVANTQYILHNFYNLNVIHKW